MDINTLVASHWALSQPPVMARNLTSVSAHTSLSISTEQESEHELFDLVTEHNAKRIQDFLDEPFKHVGDALEDVHKRLRARGVLLNEQLSKSRKASVALEKQNQRVPYLEGGKAALEKLRLTNSIHRSLGPRSRFSDGDGTYWDRWLNTTGCLDGTGKYLTSNAPVRDGNLKPHSGFKKPLVTVSDSRSAKRIEHGRLALAMTVEHYNSLQKNPTVSHGAFRKAFVFANRSTDRKLVLSTPATNCSDDPCRMNLPVSSEMIEAMLDRLDATTRLDPSGRRHVTLPCQGLDTEQGCALSECLEKTHTLVPVYSADISGNSRIRTNGLLVLIRCLAKSTSLTALDVSHASFDVTTFGAMAHCLTSGFSALKSLCLADTALDDVMAAQVVRALRNECAPNLETLDVSSNAIGSVEHLLQQHEQGDVYQHYLAPATGGPLGALLDVSAKIDIADIELGMREPSSKVTDEMRGSPALRTLRASWNLLGHEVVSGLAKAVAIHPNLVQLHLARNAFGDTGVVELSVAIEAAPSLTLLDVSDNEVGPRGAVCLAAAAHRSVALKRLKVMGNPIGLVGAALLFAVSLTGAPNNNRLRGVEDEVNSTAISVSLRGCETIAHVDAVGKTTSMDWLFNLPVVPAALTGCTPFVRTPWRYQFHLEKPLERALALEVLRITASAIGTVYSFKSCSLRHTTRHKQSRNFAVKRTLRGAPGDDLRADDQGSAKAKILLQLVNKPDRRRVLKNLVETVEYARDIIIQFALLERVVPSRATVDSTMSSRAMALEKKLPRLWESISAAEKQEQLYLDVGACLELLRSIDPAATEADARRAVSLHDFEGNGRVHKALVLYHAAAELPYMLRGHAESFAGPPYWTVKFETKPHRRWHKQGKPAAALAADNIASTCKLSLNNQASPDRPEAESAASSVSDDISETKVHPTSGTPWTPPREGCLDLRFKLGHSPPPEARGVGPPRIVARLLAAMRDLKDFESAFAFAYQANIRLQFDDALLLASSLLADGGEHGFSASRIKILASVLPLLGRYQDARALRDSIIGKMLPNNALPKGNEDSLSAYRQLRRELGPVLYYATLGPRGGTYHLDLARWSDRCALRLLLEADSADCWCAVESTQSKKSNKNSLSSNWVDLSQHGDGSNFRNVCIDGDILRSGGRRFGGAQAIVDPRCCVNGAVTDDHGDGFFPGYSMHTIHAFFDCDDVKAERRDQLTDFGCRSRCEIVFDFCPRPPAAQPKVPPKICPTARQLAEKLVRLKWLDEGEVEKFCQAVSAPQYLALERAPFLGPRESALAAFAVQHRARYSAAHDSDLSDLMHQCGCLSDDRRLSLAEGKVSGGLGQAQIEAAAACDAIRQARTRAKIGVEAYKGVGTSSRGTCGPDVALEDAFDLVASFAALETAHAIAILEWCPLADDGKPQTRPPKFSGIPNQGNNSLPDSSGAAWAQITPTCGRRRVALLVALLQNLHADHSDWAALLHALTPIERGLLLHRVGVLNVWSPLNPSGWYLVDMTIREDRCVAKCLVILEAVEGNSHCDGFIPLGPSQLDLSLPDLFDATLNDSFAADELPTALSQLWRQGLPSSGLFVFHFTSTTDPNILLRSALAQLCCGNYLHRKRTLHDFGGVSASDYVASALQHANFSPTFLDL